MTRPPLEEWEREIDAMVGDTQLDAAQRYEYDALSIPEFRNWLAYTRELEERARELSGDRDLVTRKCRELEAERERVAAMYDDMIAGVKAEARQMRDERDHLRAELERAEAEVKRARILEGVERWRQDAERRAEAAAEMHAKAEAERDAARSQLTEAREALRGLTSENLTEQELEVAWLQARSVLATSTPPTKTTKGEKP